MNNGQNIRNNDMVKKDTLFFKKFIMRIYLCKYFLKIEVECIDNYNPNGFSIFLDELAR